MNFRIIAHLVRTDWQRFKRPVVVLWIVLIITALPWLLHHPGNFQMPFWTTNGWESRLGPVPEGFTDFPRYWRSFRSLEMLATVLSLVLAAMIGAQWVKHPVTPVRGRERLVALALSLLVFLVLPQWILAFGNMLLHGFIPGIAALAAGSPTLTAWLLLGLAAVMGVWLPSPWLHLAGCAALVSAVGFVAVVVRPLGFMYFKYPTLPLLPAGPKEWLLGTMTILLLGLLFPVFRQRLNGPWKIAAVVLLILAAGIPAVLLPPPDLQVKNDPSIDTTSIRPVLQFVRMTADFRRSQAPAFDVHAQLDPIGCPPGYGVRYVPAAGWISQQGKRVASLRFDRNFSPTFRASDGYFQPTAYPDDTDLAELEALPGSGKTIAPSMRPKTQSIWLGRFEAEPGTDIPADRIAELHVEFTAIVYRYEKVWDVPLHDDVTKFREGNLIWRVRRNSTQEGEPRADVMVTHPALGLSNDPDENQFDAPILFRSWLYFHLPATGANIRVTDRLFSSSGPLFSGAGWDRAIIAPSNRFPGNADLDGLRLLRLKPVPVARFTSQTVTPFRPWLNDGTSDYGVSRRSAEVGSTYRDLFSERPDPQTCSREEFARWLRIPASMYPISTNGSQRDLAPYTPRFAGLMAKVADQESVADALRIGAPESLRKEVVDQIGSLERPDRLAEVALHRGWLSDAREIILDRFHDGEMWETDAVLALEDPTTYPVLISRFLRRPEREDYEKLRLLPGIEPMLSEAIAEAARETSPEYLVNNLSSYQNSSPYGPFLYAAKQGDAVAFATVLDLYIASSGKRAYAPFRDLTYVLSSQELHDRNYQAIADWLTDKSAASFRFDPLLRIWKPQP
ncbi:MAG: hypothetical protein V4640_07390 [Verrucomicrobiota bacterium]